MPKDKWVQLTRKLVTKVNQLSLTNQPLTNNTGLSFMFKKLIDAKLHFSINQVLEEVGNHLIFDTVISKTSSISLQLFLRFL